MIRPAVVIGVMGMLLGACSNAPTPDYTLHSYYMLNGQVVDEATFHAYWNSYWRQPPVTPVMMPMPQYPNQPIPPTKPPPIIIRDPSPPGPANPPRPFLPVAPAQTDMPVDRTCGWNRLSNLWC